MQTCTLKIISYHQLIEQDLENKRHSEILEYINCSNKVVGIIPTLISANLHSSKYFIPLTYRAGTRILEKANLALSNYFIPSTY